MGRPWPQDILEMLRRNTISMPAGETFGAIVTIDAAIARLDSVTHVTLLTDCSATAIALNSGSSGSEQMNALVKWLFSRHPSVQFLGVWLPGLSNGAADNLSRARVSIPTREAAKAGMVPVWLTEDPHALDMFRQVARQAQGNK